MEEDQILFNRAGREHGEQFFICREIYLPSPPARSRYRRSSNRSLRQVPANKKCYSAGNERISELNFATMDINELTRKVIGAGIEVHKHLGPGLLESAYEECLCHEFKQIGFPFERQKELPIVYKGEKLDCGYRLDVVVAGMLILELKACERLEPIHEAQLLTYLKLTGIKVGLLINFNVPILRDGIKRISN